MSQERHAETEYMMNMQSRYAASLDGLGEFFKMHWVATNSKGIFGIGTLQRHLAIRRGTHHEDSRPAPQ